jgi:tRNA (guanine37-N1)-methyltransferase
VFDQNEARRLRGWPHLILVCGRYEGVDERFIEVCVDEEISIGDYVITGGELAACVVADAVCRIVPGVLSGEEGFTGESHWDGMLEYPHYSRPEVWRGRAVPDILLSGHHANIEKWRQEQSAERTKRKRPDMLG